MRLGYVHAGPARGGVRRYGRHIAAEATRRSGHVVVEADPGAPRPTVRGLIRAARLLRGCDVVHLQWKPNDWGRGWRALALLALFAVLCRRPLVATVHDVYEPPPGRRARLAPEALALAILRRRARRLVVHSREEVRRLRVAGGDPALSVVPHFVEERRATESPASARVQLGLDGRRVVTLLGFITGRKGHLLLIDAITLLPGDVVALVAGAPIDGRRARVDEIERRVAELGLGDRVRITGFLDEPQLGRVLAATHVAACPFRDVSASGSVSTWISAGRPIVASDLPAFREYEELEPGAIRTFAPYEARALADALGDALGAATADDDPAVARLRDRLATPRVFDAYEAVYAEAADAA